MAQRFDVTGWLAEHPKLMGVLWMVLLLAAETGNGIAGGAPKTGP